MDRGILQPIVSGLNDIGNTAVSGGESLANDLGAKLGTGSKNFRTNYLANANNISNNENSIKNPYGIKGNVDNITTLKGGEQALGNIGQGALELSGIGDILAPGELAAKSALGTALKTGAFTGEYGVANAMSKGKDLGGVLVSGLENGAIGTGLGLAGSAFSKILSRYLPTTALEKYSDEISDILEQVSPKATSKESKLAMREGRYIPEINSKFFKNGIKATILPSMERLEGANLIKETIPKAADMDSSQLYRSLDQKGLEFRDTLKPVLQETPITKEMLNTLNLNLKNVESELDKNLSLKNEINVSKYIKDFMKIYLNGEKMDNLNDLWNSAIDYDDSVPKAVKNVNVNSHPKILAENSIWTKLRGVLRNTINDASKDLPVSSQPMFRKMSLFLRMKEDIQTTISSINNKDMASGLEKTMRKHPYILYLILDSIKRHF